MVSGGVARRRRLLLFSTVLVSLLLLLPQHRAAVFGSSASKKAGGSKGGIKKGSSSEPGAELFHRGDDALLWSNDDLLRVRHLHTKNFKADSLDTVLKSHNLAQYLGLSRVEALHMPIPLNIVLVGFSADGNLQVNISTAQIQEWLGHLDHVLPHTRIQLSQLTCAEDGIAGHCAGLASGTVAQQLEPVPSTVHLNFSCNVVVVKRKAVMTAFEHALHVFSRPVDPEVEMGAQQVDALKMQAFIDNFILSLGLGVNSYTLLVLNPTWSVDQPVYGYRVGLSQAEMDVLLPASDKVLKLLTEHYEAEPSLPTPYSGTTWMSQFGSVDRSATNKFGVAELSWNSEYWVNSVESYLKQEEDLRKSMLKSVGNMRGAAAVVQAVRLLRRLDTPLASVLKDELLAGPEARTYLYSKFRTMHPAEDCLVGNWVSLGRWVMVDLTAGGGDWGPAMGGDGVVHRHTLPSVLDHFTHLHTLKRSTREATKTQADHSVLSYLHNMKAARVSEVSSRAFHAFSLEMAARARSAGAPGAPPATGVEGTLQDPEEMARWQRVHRESTLRAEMDVYEQLARRYCRDDYGPTRPVRACSEIKGKVEAARGELAKLSSAQGIASDVWRDHKWDIFGSATDDEELLGASDELSDEAVRSHDLFMAELSALLSRAMRHVIAPPTATWTHAAGHLHSTATPFTPHVKFDIYIIQDQAREGGSAGRFKSAHGFDVEGYKRQVSSLKLSNQQFQFAVHRLQLHDDPIMATAFASATRTVHLEVPADQQTVQEAERVYVDSAALAHVLRQRFETHKSSRAARTKQELKGKDPTVLEEVHGNGKATEGSQTHTHLQIPVFIFEVERDTALLIDSHYNAKALPDMILVVENTAQDDEHPTGMMCGGGLIARPLSALREALSATLLHLGGVLPPHLGYHPQQGRVTHDWLWSVGAHPQSFTSVGTQFSEAQKDSLARSYLLDALDASVEIVNVAIDKLRDVRMTEHVHKHVVANTEVAQGLLLFWIHLVNSWKDVMTAAWSLDWAQATGQLATIEDQALAFLHYAEKLSTIPSNARCKGLIKHSTEHLVLPVLMGSLAVGAAAALYLVLGVASSRGSQKSILR